MSWRVPPYDRALAQLEVHVRATYAPRGIVVAGSIVRGESGPTSDLDVCVIHDQPWRLREQRRFDGVPVEIFVNPPEQVRRYFASEHDEGRPCTAHMFATGEPLPPVDPVVVELIREAHEWLQRPLAPSAGKLEAQRYAAVDWIDDARDVMAEDPANAVLLLGVAVNQIVEHAFWRSGRFQPRRKRAVAELDALDPAAAALVRRWSSAPDAAAALAAVEELARHVLGVDTFFEWASPRDPLV